ncbi:hypothetical protein AB0C91_10020 [Streptomyces sp. NPDC048674]|uniref:hypothetical protein n=1 Tax=Streptomyces sp. NPDC048674 TaxID=3155491 RepID=UPI00342005CF
MSWGEGSMNWAELRDLVDALPEDSATRAAEVGDDEQSRWTTATYLQAAQYNLLIMLVQILWAAHLKGKPPEMKPVQPPQRSRPDEDEQQTAEAQRRSEEYLNSFSPGTPQSDQAEIELWNSRIRELEAAQ